MALDIDAFVRLRPRLYHLTSRTNTPLISKSGVLRPASDLLRDAGREDLTHERRVHSKVVEIAGQPVHVRDQAPLHLGNMALSNNWTLADFVAHLNDHVFFWPGDVECPIKPGRNHFGRYRDETADVLVFDTAALFKANAQIEPRFSPFNSGSPRWNRGSPAPRGPETFSLAADFSRPPAEVVEVVFQSAVTLPLGSMTIKPLQSWV